MKATSKELQSFINRCQLQSIIGMHWPNYPLSHPSRNTQTNETEVIKNKDFWARTKQEWINIQIKRRRWGWKGHTLRKPISNVTRHALRSRTHKERKTKDVLETAGGEPWTVRWPRQATAERDQKIVQRQKQMELCSIGSEMEYRK